MVRFKIDSIRSIRIILYESLFNSSPIQIKLARTETVFSSFIKSSSKLPNLAKEESSIAVFNKITSQHTNKSLKYLDILNLDSSSKILIFGETQFKAKLTGAK